MSERNVSGYAGDVSARAAFDDLSRTADATLIDVRTAAEWVYVGVPDLGRIGKSPVLIEWDEFPSGELVPDFVGRLTAELDKRRIPRDAPLYFICRSGNRSRQAAILATGAGFSRSFNVDLGFEGRLSPERHRATPGSWKAEGLPWVQS
ncbi:MAG TPA: rhodanese-like domain-containing protein [Bauldia sp.]|nr:rhodanese-like domain-containing protein [Bauldia sp.]